jgi:Tol biopolymer transport system component
MVLSTCRPVWHVGRLRPGDRFEPFEARADWNDSDIQPLGGKRFAVVSDRSGTSQVWILDEGSQARLLVAEPSTHIAVSPDRTLVAWTGLGESSAGIHVTDLATGTSRRLTDQEIDDRARFSRDGSTVYFLRGASEGIRIHQVAAAGGAATPVSQPDVVGFDVSSVDDRLLWLARGGQGRTLMIGSPGGQADVVPELAVADYTSPRFAPDGRRAWLVRNGTDLLEVSLEGGSPARVVWRARNEALGELAPDPDGNGWIGDLAQYEGDLHLAEGRFR